MQGILDTSDKFNIGEISGILHYKDIPLIDFSINGFRVVYAKDLSGGKYYPYHFHVAGLTYHAFNAFFNDRVVREHAQDMRDYLDTMRLRHYDFDELIKKMNGWDALGYHWVKFTNIGAKNWRDICTQRYPIY